MRCDSEISEFWKIEIFWTLPNFDYVYSKNRISQNSPNFEPSSKIYAEIFDRTSFRIELWTIPNLDLSFQNITLNPGEHLKHPELRTKFENICRTFGTDHWTSFRIGLWTISNLDLSFQNLTVNPSELLKTPELRTFRTELNPKLFSRYVWIKIYSNFFVY